ncbi:MAG: precorrin-2 C(20)-methyltransferase [Candidatus Methanoplasma sp.]|jgi:precorrin-2/cobalt-factor-2 C20-methyltransferase|nr:precorrin-2 C(20)-methyltransferase [Candidatus Methanoplasma sp.]
MAGRLYGVGVGPGDPDLLTLKAIRCVEAADVIAYPVKAPGEKGTALEIVMQRADLSQKETVELIFGMNADDKARKSDYGRAVAALSAILDGGKSVAVITLGDVSLYSTYMRLNADMEARGYKTAVIPGVASFCSGAAEARMPLTIGEEGLAVVSMNGDPEEIRAAVESFDNIVLMKAGGHMGEVVKLLGDAGLKEKATIVSNIGMDGQYVGPVDEERQYGYFTTVIVKKGE